MKHGRRGSGADPCLLPIPGTLDPPGPPHDPIVLARQHEDMGMPPRRQAPAQEAQPGSLVFSSSPQLLKTSGLCTSCYPFENSAADLFEFADLQLPKCHQFLKKVPHPWCIFHFPGWLHTLLSPSVPRGRGSWWVAACCVAALHISLSRSPVSPPKPLGSTKLTWGGPGLCTGASLSAAGVGPSLEDVTTGRGRPSLSGLSLPLATSEISFFVVRT